MDDQPAWLRRAMWDYLMGEAAGMVRLHHPRGSFDVWGKSIMTIERNDYRHRNPWGGNWWDGGRYR